MTKTPPTDEPESPLQEETCITEHDNEQARNAVLTCGLAEGVAKAAERKGQMDWRPLAAAFDSLYVARGGPLGVRTFLMTPQKTLNGAVPSDLIARGDLQRVAGAAYNEAVRADIARCG